MTTHNQLTLPQLHPASTTRRQLIKSMGACGLCAALAPTAHARGRVNEKLIEVLGDSGFTRGANVFRPEQGEKVVTGKVCAYGGECMPVWNIAQWCSNYDLSHVKPEVLPSGSLRYFDGAKEVIFGHPNTQEADLTLSVNGRTEYKDVFPTGPHTWPHLYVQQTLPQLPQLSHLAEMPFNIETRLKQSDFLTDHKKGVSGQTAQFMFMLTVGNTNPASKGFHDSLWFIVPMYDARYDLPVPIQMKDKGNAVKKGTNKFIFSAGGAAFSDIPAIEGKWVRISKDFLPLVKDSLTAAWSSGFLEGSHDLADYSLQTAVMGWEVPGLTNVSMQLRGLSLKLHLS